MMLVVLYLLIAGTGIVQCLRDVDFVPQIWDHQSNSCVVGPKGRIPWIMSVRNSDYGWNENTHRALIALAVNRYPGSEDEMKKMELQLEVEITKLLFRNSSNPIHESDLALYINALVALNKNPCNFHGINLVKDLLHRVENARGNVHPYLVLTLCNSRVVTYDHLLKIKNFMSHSHNNHSDVDSREAQLKAIAMKAFACAASLNNEYDKFQMEMDNAANCLRRKHNTTDGSFGNVYTTSLAVQALTASKKKYDWNEKKAREFLLKESEIDVNLIKAYYIELALNAKEVKFLKDLNTGKCEKAEETVLPETHWVQYTIKASMRPDIYFSVSLQVPKNESFYDIMKKAARLSDNFKFDSYENQQRQPMVYAVSGVPNDAEENHFWRFCRQFDVDHNRHTSTITTHTESPSTLIPRTDEHVIVWYRNAECPTK